MKLMHAQPQSVQPRPRSLRLTGIFSGSNRTSLCHSVDCHDHRANVDDDHDPTSKNLRRTEPKHDHDQVVSMTSELSSSCALQETIRLNRFYSLDEDALLYQIEEAFRPELERLKSAVAVERSSPPRNGNSNSNCRTPSEILYGVNYDEVNRTLVGVLALRWIWMDDYEQFTWGQPGAVRLRHDSFEWLRNLFARNLKSPEDLFALVLSMVINDLGKDPNLQEDFFHETRVKLEFENHDSILLEAAKVGMVPCLDMLKKTQRDNVMLGLELGSELNAGQLAQAESVPINLEGLLHMRGNEHAFELKFMEQVLDVAGAAGHVYAGCAKNFIEPVFQAFMTVHEVSLDIIAGRSNLRQGYDTVLTKRGDMLHSQGFRKLHVENSEERALLRLLTMGRTADREQAELFLEAFEALDKRTKDILVLGLNIDGKENETAVLPYYMPAILSETMETTKDLSGEGQRKALTSLMKYLSRVLAQSSIPQSRRILEDPDFGQERTPGIVIEHNMMKAREVIGSDGFRTNPDMLDGLDIPKGQMLQRRRTSHSLESPQPKT